MNPHADSERRDREAVDALRARRAQTLSLYQDLYVRRPLTVEYATEQILQDFCQSLLDYLSDAYFHLYRYIDEGRERRRGVRAEADAVYAEIRESGHQLLAFNEEYHRAALAERIEGLDDHLYRLESILQRRMQLEDRIIAAHLDRHRTHSG